jgi:hypothetical protein
VQNTANAHTHTHTCTHAKYRKHTHAHTHTHTLTHMHARKIPQKHTCTKMHTQSHKHTHTHANTPHLQRLHTSSSEQAGPKVRQAGKIEEGTHNTQGRLRSAAVLVAEGGDEQCRDLRGVMVCGQARVLVKLTGKAQKGRLYFTIEKRTRNTQAPDLCRACGYSILHLSQR